MPVGATGRMLPVRVMDGGAMDDIRPIARGIGAADIPADAGDGLAVRDEDEEGKSVA